MRALAVVPTYQEAGTITRLLDAILDSAPYVDILVVDDASPDGTADLVTAHPRFEQQIFILGQSGKSGLGTAYRAGFAWALAQGYEAILEMDADLSHPPAAIPALLAALDVADLVIGSRYVPGGRTVGWSPRRRLLSRAGNAYVRVVLGLPVRDATGGFRAFRAATLEGIEVLGSESDGYSFQVETTWRAQRLGLRVREVPITFTERAAGESKMTLGIAVEAVSRVLGWRLREILGTRTPRERPRVQVDSR